MCCREVFSPQNTCLPSKSSTDSTPRCRSVGSEAQSVAPSIPDWLMVMVEERAKRGRARFRLVAGGSTLAYKNAAQARAPALCAALCGATM